MIQTNDSQALNLVLLIQGFLLTSTKKYKKHGPLNVTTLEIQSQHS